MTIDDLIDATIEREGRIYGDQTTHPPIDQPTAAGGITAAVLAAYTGRQVTIDDLKALTVDTVRPVIRWQITTALTRYHFDRILFEPLRLQLFDYGYNSGYERAVRWLQRTVGLPEAVVTGILDDRTLLALSTYPPVLINNALAASRAHAAYHGGTAPEYAAGVAHRAIEFAIDTTGDHPGEAGIHT